MLVPPLNFGIVEENVYRCSKLETLNLSFIESLGLKLIIFIMTEDPSRIFKEFMKSMKIEWIVINPNSYTSISSKDEKAKSHGLSRESSTDDSVGTLLRENSTTGRNNSEESNNLISTYNSNQYMVGNEYGANNSFFLIHPKVIYQVFNLMLDKSNNNVLLVDKTALLIGMLRKIQKWQLSSILDEYRMITGKHSSYNAECFLEFVKIEIVQEKPKNFESTGNSKQQDASQNEDEDGEDEDIGTERDKNFDVKRSQEEHKLKLEHQRRISKLITDKLFDTPNEEVISEKENLQNSSKQKIKILIDVDLETFDPPVPEYFEAIINDIEEESKRLSQDAIDKLEKIDDLEQQRREKKKNKDINKYSMKFNKSKQETTAYEYYKPNPKNHKSNISKRLTETNKIATSAKKSTDPVLLSINANETSNQAVKKQPFTRSSITFEPLPYCTEEEKTRNDLLTKEYGASVASFVFLKSIPIQHATKSSNTSISSATDKQLVIVKVPVEDRLQDWFVQKRNIWEEENTFENHKERVFI